jgi:tetratricopeptide (TPR) repeat protein
VSRRTAAALLLCSLAAAGCSDRGVWRAELVEVPEVWLEPYEAADRVRLAEARARLERDLELRSTTGAQAAAAFGELGRIYAAHELDHAAEACFVNAAALDPGDRRWPYFLGVLAQGGRRFDDAVARFRRALELAPGDGPTLVRLGEIELERHRLEESRALFEAARDDPDTAVAAEFGLGRVAAAADELAAAAEHFERVLAGQPDASSVRHPLAMALRRRGDERGAREQLARAGSGRVRFDDELIDGLSELVVGARSLLLRGDRAREEGDPETALRHYRLAVEADPDLDLAHHALGTLLAERGETAEALVHLERATELNPDFPEALYNLATLLLRSGRRDETLAALDRVVSLDPGHADARLRRAALLRDGGELERAREDLEAILARDPRQVEAIENLAGLLVRGGAHDRAEALLRSALAAEPPAAERARLEAARGFVASQRGDTAGAVAGYRRAVAADPAFADGWFNLAVVLAAAGRHDEAATAFSEVVHRQPLNVRAHLGLGLGAMAQRRWPEARAAFEDGLRELPGDPHLARALAELLAACPDRSVRDGERALELAEAAYRARPDGEVAEVVAMALAEAGRYEEAAAVIGQLLARAEQLAAPAAVRERLAAARERYARGEAARLPGE